MEKLKSPTWKIFNHGNHRYMEIIEHPVVNETGFIELVKVEEVHLLQRKLAFAVKALHAISRGFKDEWYEKEAGEALEHIDKCKNT